MNESSISNDLLKDYVTVNRLQRNKIELLNKELIKKNELINELLEENRKLKEKCRDKNILTKKIGKIFDKYQK